MRARFLFALALCLSLTSSVYSQTNDHPGLVVLLSGDTLRGFIDYKEWHFTPTVIHFKTAAGSEARGYSPSDISYFEVKDKVSYYRYILKRSMSTSLLNYLPDQKDTTTLKEAIFLKMLHRGKNVTLFSFVDNVKLRWYILQKDKDTPEELLNSFYRVNGQVANEREYRLQLQRLATQYKPDDAQVRLIIHRASHTRKEIMKICYRLNDATKEKSLPNGSDSEKAVQFFAGAGLNLYTVEFAKNDLFAGKKSSSQGPAGYAGFDFFIVPSVKKIFLRTQLSISGTKSTIYSDIEQYYEATGQYIFDIKQFNVSLHSRVSYNFYNARNFKWFGGAGGGFNVSSSMENTRTYVREGYDSHVNVRSGYLDLKKVWLNASFNTGVTFKKIEFSVLYCPPAAISSYATSKAKSSSFQVQVNYRF